MNKGGPLACWAAFAFAVKVSVVGGLVYYLVHTQKISYAALGEAVLYDKTVLVGGGLVLANMLVCFLRQWCILQALGSGIALTKVIRYSWVAAAFGQISLGGLATDTAKGYYLRDASSIGISVVAVIIDRLMAVASLFFMWVLVLLLNYDLHVSLLFPAYASEIIWGGGGACLIFLVACLQAKKITAQLCRIKAVQEWGVFWQTHQFAKERLIQRLLQACGLSIVAQALVFYTLLILNRIDGCSLSYGGTVLAGAPAVVSLFIPLPFGALGTGELLYHTLAGFYSGASASDCPWANGFLVLRLWLILISLAGLFLLLFPRIFPRNHRQT